MIAPAPDPLARVRSLLFAPGDDQRKLESALRSEADAVIADLEDAVPESNKEAARETVARAYGAASEARLRGVRIGALGTTQSAADLRLLESLPCDFVVVPKASPAAIAQLTGSPPALALVETAAGVRGAYEIACAPTVVALMLGPADLAAELGLWPRDDGQELLHARSKLVLDSAAAGIGPPLDGPRLDFSDEAGLRREVALARALGFGGKACIHPAQVPAINAGFAPSAEELDWARRVIGAFESADRAGSGVVSVDGAMVDEPVVARVRRILARAPEVTA